MECDGKILFNWVMSLSTFKQCFCAVCLCLILAVFVAPVVCTDVVGDVPEASALMDMAWRFITDVLMLDVSKCNMSVQVLGSPTALGARPSVDVLYRFAGAECQFHTIFTFEDGRLAACFVYFDQGMPVLTGGEPGNPLDWVRLLMERYARFSGKDYIADMCGMLAAVKGPENFTVIDGSVWYPSWAPSETLRRKLTGFMKNMGNVRFAVVVEPGSDHETNTTYVKWTYTENGILFSQKTVGVTILCERRVTQLVFVDQWDIYRVGSAELRISEEEAVRLAKEYAKQYVYTSEGRLVGNFTFLEKPLYTYLGTHYRGDYYTLYPYWKVYLCLDKMYPGGVTGIEVLLWADTGEKISISVSGVGGPPPSQEPDKPNVETSHVNIQQLIAIAAIIITAMAACYICIKRRAMLAS